MSTAILVSGGLDSALCLAMYSGRQDVVAVTIEYGQPHYQELAAAGRLCNLYGVLQHRVRLSDAFKSGVGLWGADLNEASSTVVPHRNALFITTAAAATCAGEVVIGCNKDDYAAYEDCRPGYLYSLGEALGITITAPLTDMTKQEVHRAAVEAGVPVEETVSCYRGTGCGTCAACMQRGGF